MWYVYVLKCNDKKLYTGCSSDLRLRLKHHQEGFVTSTKKRRPVKLLLYVAFVNKYRAFEFEKYLKTGSGRAFCKRHFTE